MSAPKSIDPARALLRHTVATLAYRGAKAIRGAPPHFASFQVAAGTRTPGEILAHIGDLIDWSQTLARGKHEWRPLASQGWDADAARFHASLLSLDSLLASDEPVQQLEQVFQGPIADALCHVGQITMLRRLAGAPVRAENYAKADIAAGMVGAAQPASRAEFD
jgi:hypothetical protein